MTLIREAVALEAKELERLHKIDIAATAIDHLVEDYHLQKQNLEQEISAQRKQWDVEELERAGAQKDFEDNPKRQRQPARGRGLRIQEGSGAQEGPG